MAHTRDWIDIFQALLTPVIALIALSIAFAQWWTARNKWKLDLFDRRWAMYVVVRETLSEMIVRANLSEEGRRKYLHGIRGAKWLFDDQINTYLMKELYSQVIDLQEVNQRLQSNAAGPGQPSPAAKRAEILVWASKQNDTAVDAMFGDFLVLDQKFSVWLCRRMASLTRARASRAA